MHQQAFGGVADPRTLALRVDENPHSHWQVGGCVDIDVADAVVVLDDRHLGFGHDALDQRLAAARNGHVDVLRHLQELPHGIAINSRHKLHGMRRQARRRESFGQHAVDGQVAVQGLFSSPQDDRIAALHADRSCVGSDVRARLVNEEHHA